MRAKYKIEFDGEFFSAYERRWFHWTYILGSVNRDVQVTHSVMIQRLRNKPRYYDAYGNGMT